MQALVRTFGLDERTIAHWRELAGQYCQKVQQALVERGDLDLQHVQADEIRAKTVGGLVWLGMAIAVGSRLWLGGVVSTVRDRALMTT